MQTKPGHSPSFHFAPAHNHITRDIKPKGKCPACDYFHWNKGTGEEQEVTGD